MNSICPFKLALVVGLMWLIKVLAFWRGFNIINEQEVFKFLAFVKMIISQASFDAIISKRKKVTKKYILVAGKMIVVYN